MTPTLYLSRTGMLEPLGQSQVLSYLRGLSRDYAVTLISFERAADLEDREQLARIERLCADHGVRWLRLRYRRRPRVLASASNLIALILLAWRETRASRTALIHARSYIPAMAAWAVSRLRGVPFIFDMRSLWTEELITSRRLRRGSLLHKLIFGVERRLLSDAAAVVSLTRAAVAYLQSAHPGVLSQDRLRIIPTCADLDRFRPPETSPEEAAFVIGCHGSLLNGWFHSGLLDRAFRRLARRLPQARFEIITREAPDAVLAALDGAEGYADRLTVSAAGAADIHARLQRHRLSVFFYASGAASELGRSPTRMGEALGCGVPVFTNGKIGDVSEIVREWNVGVVLEDPGDAGLDGAIDALCELWADPDLASRCRRAAESVYSLEKGTRAYADLYRQLTAGRSRTASGEAGGHS